MYGAYPREGVMGRKFVSKVSLNQIFRMSCFLSIFPVVGNAAQFGDFGYAVTDGTVIITNYTGSGGAIIIPGSIESFPVTSIGDNVFLGRTALTNVVIPNGITRIGTSAFRQCSGLSRVTIPDSVITVANYAFYYCSGLTHVTIGAGTTSLGQYAFSSCSGLNEVKIPNSVSSIGNYAFRYCSGLAGITLGTGVTSIGNEAFKGCGLSNLVIPDNVITIGYGAFDSCSLVSVTIGNGVTSIGDGAFQGCTQLTRAVIGTNVTSIGWYAFQRCNKMKGIYFHGNAPTPGGYAFYWNDNVTTVYYLPGTTGWTNPWAACPAVVWNPRIQMDSTSFGVRSNRFEFVVTGSNNFDVAVESCTNLTGGRWEFVQTGTLSGGSFLFSDSQITNYAGRFYRLRMP